MYTYTHIFMCTSLQIYSFITFSILGKITDTEKFKS